VLVGRFIPAIRPLVPFLLGITDLRLKRFYLADLIACFAWAIALALLVVSVGSIFK
jgi:membrane protein DedA with SNARE-associated domain